MDKRWKNRFKLAGVLAVLLVISYFLSGTQIINPLTEEDKAHMDERVDLIDEELEDKNGKDTDDKELADAKEDKIEDGEEEEKLKDGDKDEKEETKVASKNETKEKLVEEAKKISQEEKAEIDRKVKKEKEEIIKKSAQKKGQKDKYLTDPVPEGKPKPVEFQDVTINKDVVHKATLSVTCKSILNNMHMFNMDKIDVLPEDGIIYGTREVSFYEGESVFDVLLREMKDNGIHMEFEMTPIYNSHYIQGINNLYEFDCGEGSGWMYRVNGWFPNYGVSRYMLSDGDKIEFIYTCDLGRDIGGAEALGL